MRTPRSIILVLLLAGGCVVKPRDASTENDRLDEVAKQSGYQTRRERPTTRPLVAELPQSPTWQDVLRRALLANGELEGSFHEWSMAVERIDQAGSWPSENLELGFDYMFSGESMKNFDRLTVSAGLMDGSTLPNQAYTKAKVAWKDAQSAGERFRAMKFDLQMRVLQAWADYVLQAERVRIEEQNLSLLELLNETASSRVRAGGAQQELIRADVELRMARNELQTSRSALDQQRSRLNALLGRSPQASIAVPTTLPALRAIDTSDDELLAAGVANNAELASLGFDAEARTAAITRARHEYLPTINPMAAFTGSVSQSIGASIGIPTQIPRIQAMIAEARADLRRVEATLTQTRRDRGSQFVSTLLALRDAERRAGVFEAEILPLAQQGVELTQRSYAAGASSYLELIEAQRTLLQVRLMRAEAWAMRERLLAGLESLAGMDIETVKRVSQETP